MQNIKDKPKKIEKAKYDKWLEDEIAAGLSELKAGQGIPADKVWESLDS